MSAITIENDLVHYEVLGRGRPVIFVHGWLGSWRYWVPTMQALSVKYRAYALDLWGFGDSGKVADHYSFNDQVKLLYEFMDKLGIAKAALVGHSFGAAVALRFALQHADRAPRLALVSPPLFDLGGLDTPMPAPIPAVPSPSNGSSNASETIVRNPFRALGDSPEEILARLQARNAINAAGTSPATGGSRPLPSTAPALPTSIGKTILATQTPPAAPAAPVQPAAPTTATPATPNAPTSTSPVPAAPTATSPATPPVATSVTPPAIPTAPSVPSILSPLPLGSTPARPAAPPAKPEPSNPLVSILTSTDKTTLLTRYVDRTSPDLDKLKAEVDKTDAAAITKSAQSFSGVNLAAELHRLSVPTLLLHGKDDPLLPAPSDDLVHRIGQGKSAGHLLAFIEPELRHFPMLEISAKFNRLLMDFLDAQDLTNVQFKDQWRRTMR